jgi:hypothetical protein
MTSEVTLPVDAAEVEDAVGWTTVDGALPVDATEVAPSLDAEAVAAVEDEDAIVGSTVSLVTTPVDAIDTVEEEGSVEGNVPEIVVL